MTPMVSAVIPTIGRPSLARAVQSVLDQTQPVAEIIVVADTDAAVPLPSDDRIILLRMCVGSGPARCRQLGIDAARGTVIALLDDDDEWHTTKLARQLEAVDSLAGTHWIASSRMVVLGPGTRRRIWPRRLIEPGESIAEYLFRLTDLRLGGAALQTSTLCFPADLAREVRWDAHAGAAKDEPSWLIRVQRTIPDVRVVQLPDVLSTYNVQEPSRSRDKSDRTDEYIEWGLQYLAIGVASRARRLSVHQSGQRGRVRAIAERSTTFAAGGVTVRTTRPLRSGVCGSQCGADRRPFGRVGKSLMTVDQGRLAPDGASCAALRSPLPHPRHARHCRARPREHRHHRA